MSYENGLWTSLPTQGPIIGSGRRFLQLVIVVINRVSGRSVDTINIIG